MGLRQSFQSSIPQPEACCFRNAFRGVELLEDHKARGLSHEGKNSLVYWVFFYILQFFSTLSSQHFEISRYYCSYFTDKETKAKPTKEVKWTTQGHITHEWSQKSELCLLFRNINLFYFYSHSCWFLSPIGCLFFLFFYPVSS